MSLTWPPKDPNEVLDYQIDWSARLGVDTISTSIWTVPSGLVKTLETNDTKTTTVWLSAGNEGASYAVLNRVLTAAGRTMDQTVKLRIKSK